MKTIARLGSLITLITLCSCGGGGSSGGGAAQTPTPPVTTTPQPTKPGVLAISALPKLEPGPATLVDYVNAANDAFNMVYNAGARGQMTTFTWHELEPQSGAYDSQKFDDLAATIAKAQSQTMTQYLGLKIIDTTAREMPDQLSTSAFDDAAVIGAFHALLERVITPNRGKVAYLSIGNEVDAYLRAHPDEWTHYQAFYEDALQYAHVLDPSLKVGVTVTADGALTQSPAEAKALNTKSDVVILTYYPITFASDGAVTVRDPSAVSSDLPLMLTFAGTRPLVMQEVGYPASALNNSSEQKQATFVTNFFVAWRNAQQHIPFVNYFLLHDFTQSMCDQFGDYYGLPNSESFKAYLCSLGLRQSNGTPRQAWTTLQTEAAQSDLP